MREGKNNAFCIIYFILRLFIDLLPLWEGHPIQFRCNLEYSDNKAYSIFYSILLGSLWVEAVGQPRGRWTSFNLKPQ